MGHALHSPAFGDGAPIPQAYSHDRGDVSPPVVWDGVPDDTGELLLLVGDPDAPIRGSYVFRLLALDQAMQPSELPSYAEVAAAAEGHVLAEARLIGTYLR